MDADVIIPEQMLIFMDITDSFVKPFKVGQCYISESGCYGIGRSFQSPDLVVAHHQSKFVKFGTFTTSTSTNKPEPCMFSVDTIYSACIAVP